MPKFLTVILFSINFSLIVNAQFSNLIWCFGDSSGIDFSGAIPTTFKSSMDCRGGTCSIANSSNELLFYAHTGNFDLWFSSPCLCATSVINKLHQTMLNGDSLIGEITYEQVVIVPYPGDSNLFYLFHLASYANAGLYYSLIDISLDSGKGKVIQKNVPVITSDLFSGLDAFKHGNGRDWWLVTKPSTVQSGGNPLNDYYVFNVSPSGISNQIIQSVGSTNSTDLGSITFNHQGNTLVFVNVKGLIELYDFDRCTGIISNSLSLRAEVTSQFPYFWGAEFSPNDSVLYVSSTDFPSLILQYDLTAPNVPNSVDTIASIAYPTYTGGYLRLAPDNKIYWSCSWYDGVNFNYPYPDTTYNLYNMNLSVINEPNLFGSACLFQPFSYYLGGSRTYYGLPNNPDYNKFALGGSSCDTLGLPNYIENNKSHNSSLSVFNHQEWQTAFINASGLKGKYYSIHIISIAGSEIYSENGILYSEYYTKDFQYSRIASGTYLVLLETESERLVKKLIIE